MTAATSRAHDDTMIGRVLRLIEAGGPDRGAGRAVAQVGVDEVSALRGVVSRLLV